MNERYQSNPLRRTQNHGRVLSPLSPHSRQVQMGVSQVAPPAQNLFNQPKAYIDGIQDFYGRDFIVTSDVLIPRPETEQIIDSALNLAGKSYLPGVKPSQNRLPENPTVLDVGTGSGCIAITIAKELPEAIVYATDISKEALKIAQKNAKLHDVHISFIISHLLENVKFTPDLIVANLPYVDPDWKWLNKDALSYEPSIALYANDHGLALIKELLEESAKRNIRYLILEADPCQHNQITAFAKNNSYSLSETRGYALVFYMGQQ